MSKSLLARPIVPLSNRDLGYLPGDVNAKLEPYMQPLFDNLKVIRNQFSGYREKAGSDRQDARRGSPFNYPAFLHSRSQPAETLIFIIDEAQNLTPHEVKTVITRAAEGTKIVSYR